MSFLSSFARSVLRTASHSTHALPARQLLPSSIATFSSGSSSTTRHVSPLLTRIPSFHTQRASIRIKASEPSNNTDKKQAPETQKRTESVDDNAEDAQGMDLFAQALASQKRRETEAAPRTGEVKVEGEAPGEEIDPAEKERQRKWEEQAAEEETKQMAKSGRLMLGSMLLFGLGCYIYLGMPDESQQPKPGESFLKNHHHRAWENIKKMRTTLASPALEKLLPDPLPVPYQRPLTLCVELTDALVHLEWDKSAGWRVATRPGVKQFLANLSRYYEVVIFTNSPGYLAEPVCQALDPHFFYAMYRLYRDHTKLVDGIYVKDLSQLNRDLSKTVVLDINPESFKLQPENGLQLKPWKGERDDGELKKLETFFEELYVFMTVYGIEDVRPLLKIVNTINPTDVAQGWETYKQRAREEFNARQREQEATAKPASRSWLASILGGASSQQQPQIANVIDQIEAIAREERALAIKDAEAMKQQMEELQKQQEEFIKKQMEENKNKGLKLWDYINGAGAPVPPGQHQAQ